MPIHDWTRVKAGIFHDFHHAWIEEIKRTLNAGLLPPDFYALAEQITGRWGPDVVTLEHLDHDEDPPSTQDHNDPTSGSNTVAVALRPPRARYIMQSDAVHYVRRQSRVVIRSSEDDRVIALIEIVSPGNKSTKRALDTFVEKAADSLADGYHLLILDLQPPTPRDPQGLHGRIWDEIANEHYASPHDKPLTVVAYCADDKKTAYVEPLAFGDPLPDMPLFLTPDEYVPIPLEATYQSAFASVPHRWRRELE